MFGWRHVGTTHNDRRRFGLYLETFSTGLWLNVYWDRDSWAFTRYTKNRHTGPESNRDVLRHFHNGPDRRQPFGRAFAEAAQKPTRNVDVEKQRRLDELRARQPKYLAKAAEEMNEVADQIRLGLPRVP